MKEKPGRMWHTHWRTLGIYELWVIKRQENDIWKYSQFLVVCAPHKIFQWVRVASPGGNTALSPDLGQALGSGSALTHALTPRVLIILDICMGVVMFPHSLFYWGLVKRDRCQHSLAARAVHTFTTELCRTSSHCSPGTFTPYVPRLLPQFLSSPSGQSWLIISSYFNLYLIMASSWCCCDIQSLSLSVICQAPFMHALTPTAQWCTVQVAQACLSVSTHCTLS